MSRFTNLRLDLSDDKLISVSIHFYDTYLIDRTTSDLVPQVYRQLTSKLQCNPQLSGNDYFLITRVYTTQTQNGIMFVTDGAFNRKSE